MSIKFFNFRLGTYTEVFKSPDIDFCKMVDSKWRIVNFQKFLIETLRLSAPQFFHGCPYFGVHDMPNIKPTKQFIEIFPVGIFRLIVRFYDKSDASIVTFNLTFEILKLS